MMMKYSVFSMDLPRSASLRDRLINGSGDIPGLEEFAA
jgi:hypothetical protein